MERTRTSKRSPLFVPARAILAVLIAVYLPVCSCMARSERSREAPAPGTALSVFFTSQLAGYREPCG